MIKNINNQTTQVNHGSDSEWKDIKLGDVADFGNGKVRPKSFGAIPVYGGNGILDFCNESNFKNETIVIGRVGAYCGSVYYENKPIWISDNALAAKPKEKFHTKFLYYYLKNLGLNQFAEGSSHQLITQSLMNSIDIFITDNFNEQKAIASVLSSLDDKIDILHRQNKTLESIAETLFRQWFVEPVRRGGEVDKSWEEKPLSYFGNIICGKTPSKKVHRYFNGDIPFIKIPDMHGNIFIFKTSDSLTEEGKQCQANKTLSPNSICVSCIATVGLVSLTSKESQTNQQINSIIPAKEFYRYFLYLFLKSSYDLLHSMASGGTATLNLNTGDFSNILVFYPGDDKLRHINEKVEPLFDKIFSNQSQIITLEKLRDILLPKLMSGEVRVKIN